MRAFGGAVVAILALAALAGFGFVSGGPRTAGAQGGAAAGRNLRAGDGALRSTLIYPPERITIRMNHALPAHRRLRCVRCHEGAGRSDEAADSLAPAERTCRPCHDADITRDEPSQERCGTCHVGYGEASALVVPASEHPAARIKFSHATHVRFGGMRCLECHEGVDRAALGTRSHLPTMRSCLRCHGGAQPTAPEDCATCHLTRADGTLRTHWPEGTMNPRPWQLGMHHDRDWMVRHRWVGADHGSACASCHRDSDCEDCHDGRVRPERIHPSDYLTVHSQMARRDAPQCTSCHTTQTFCNECHARLGISPAAAPQVRATGRFHPPAKVWVRGPVQHALEARRSMSTCSSCHAERDCVQCHGALGIGAGLSPHPPGFDKDCGRWLARNDRACRTCHGDLDALRARCR